MANHSATHNESDWSKLNHKWQQYLYSSCPTLDNLDHFKSAAFPVFLSNQQAQISAEVPSTSLSTETDSKSDDESNEGLYRGSSKKRELNRIRRREERSNPTYRDKERARARLRMQEKRKDPIYREHERMKNRLRMRMLRSTGGEDKSDNPYKSRNRRKMKQSVVNTTVHNIEPTDCRHPNAIQSLNHRRIFNFIK